MPIAFQDRLAVFHEVVEAIDAEPLWAWMVQGPAQVDLRTCTHLHAAVLQVLLAARPGIVAWPDDPELRQWMDWIGIPEADEGGRIRP